MSVQLFKLKRAKAKHTVKRMVFVDTETLPDPDFDGEPSWQDFDCELHKLRLGCATYVELENFEVSKREVFDFTTLAQWWEWLYSHCRRKGTLWIFTHNVGFDATVLDLWGEIDRGNQHIPMRFEERDGKLVDVGTVCVLDDPPTILEVQDRAGRRMRWIDTLNYWRMSLDSLGSALKVPKLPMPDWEAPDQDWLTYCRRDVDVIERAITGLIRWVGENHLGKFRFTAPSQAMGAFRHSFMHREILFHDNLEVRRLEREAYYGGQVEIYRHGQHRRRIFQLDVTSLYPSIMASNLFPYRLEHWHVCPDSEAVEPWDIGLCGVARVLIDTRERSYPVRHDGSTLYPVGRYWTTLCGPELMEAIQSGHAVKMGSWSLYKLDTIFEAYVRYFWNLRKDAKQRGDILYDLMCKLMLNSLYGKFGQRGSEWVFVPDVVPEYPWRRWEVVYADTGEWKTYHAIGEQVRERQPRGEYDKAFPAIAGFCTSYARQRMLELRRKAGFENVYYQAVDALYVTRQGLDNLKAAGEVGDRELGKLTLEGSGCPCDFRNINNYSLGDKHVIGSLKRCRECHGTGSLDGERCRACHGLGVPSPDHTGKYPQLAFEHLASILTREPMAGVVIRRTHKSVKMNYERGTIAKGGWVEPLVFDLIGELHN